MNLLYVWVHPKNSLSAAYNLRTTCYFSHTKILSSNKPQESFAFITTLRITCPIYFPQEFRLCNPKSLFSV